MKLEQKIVPKLNLMLGEEEEIFHFPLLLLKSDNTLINSSDK